MSGRITKVSAVFIRRVLGCAHRRRASLTPAGIWLLLLGACGGLGGALGQAGVVSGVTDNADPEDLPTSLERSDDTAAAVATGSDDSLMDYDSGSGGPLKPTGSVGGASVSPSFNFTEAAALRRAARAPQEAVPAPVAEYVADDAAAEDDEDEEEANFGMPQREGVTPPQPALQTGGGAQTMAEKLRAGAEAAAKQLTAAERQAAAAAGQAAAAGPPQQSGGYGSGLAAAPVLAQPPAAQLDAAAKPSAAAKLSAAVKPSAAQGAAAQPLADQVAAAQLGQPSALGVPADDGFVDLEDLSDMAAEGTPGHRAAHAEAWLEGQLAQTRAGGGAALPLRRMQTLIKTLNNIFKETP